MYKIVLTKRALKDKELLKQEGVTEGNPRGEDSPKGYRRPEARDAKRGGPKAGLGKKAKALLDMMGEDPFQTPPSYEKLSGNLRGCYSRRISLKHRMVYEVYEEEKTIKILALWSHYGD